MAIMKMKTAYKYRAYPYIASKSNIKMIVIGITGSPGTGKTYFSKMVRDKFNGANIIELNDIIKERKAFTGIDNEGTMIVDIKKLNKIVRRQLAMFAEIGRKTRKKQAIIYIGHLVPELSIRLDACFVMRSRLALLGKRMAARGYSREKIRENLVSEAVDYCGAKAAGISKKVYEVETYAEKKNALKILRGLLKHGPAKTGKKQATPKKSIDKMPELLRMIKNKNIYRF